MNLHLKVNKIIYKQCKYLNKAIENAKQEGRSTWRISSTLFYHVENDKTLKVLMKNKNEKQYYPILKSDYIRNELSGISLLKK